MGYLTHVFSRAKSGRKCYLKPAFLGGPGKRDKIRIGYLTPAYLGAHKQGDKIRMGYLSPAFSGAH